MRASVSKSRLFNASLGAFAIVMAGCQSSRADMFSFSYTGTGGVNSAEVVNIVATLTATSNGDGSYTVTSATGTWNSVAISLLTPANSWQSNDNLVFTSGNSGKIVDYGGLAFQTVGGSDIDIYYDFVDNHVYASNSSVGNPYTTVKPDRELLDVTLTPAAAPAPGPVPGGGIISLLGLGFAWSASRFRRSRREARSANGDCPCGVADNGGLASS